MLGVEYYLAVMNKYRKHSLSPNMDISQQENINLNNLLGVDLTHSHTNRHPTNRSSKEQSTIYSHITKQLNFDSVTHSQHGKDSTVGRAKGVESGKESVSQSVKKEGRHDLKEIVRSKDKQLKSLHSHVKVLENTIDLLKEEISKLNRENIFLMEEQGRDKVDYRK